MENRITTLTFNTPRFFILLFILTVPFDYHIFPNIGNWFLPLTESLTEWSSKHIFGLEPNSYSQIISDSSGMYIHVLHLFLFSLFLSFLFKIRVQFIDRILPYYLSLMLLIYGFNKVFLFQFYFPEPNILFTPLGQLSKDILYWSSMGTSTSYNLFMGFLELLPAFLLFFKKTRVLGAVISLGVLIHVFFINIGFDISVKVLSMFLILVNLIILAPFLNTLFQFFTGKKTQPLTLKRTNKLQNYMALFAIIFILTESLFPYFNADFSFGDELRKNQLTGSYNVTNSNRMNRIHFHSDQHLIVETEDQFFKSYPYTKKQNQLFFPDSKIINYTLQGNNLKLKTDSVTLSLKKINIEQLPISKDKFSWTLEGSLSP